MKNRSTSFSTLALALAALTVLAPMNAAHSAPADNEPVAFVRFLHALSLGTKVDVTVDGDKILNDVEFGAITKYIRVRSGYRSIHITTNNPTRTLLLTSRNFRQNDFYTLSPYGTPTRLRFLADNDSTGTPAFGRAQLTAYHLSPGLSPFDVVAYLPGGRIQPLIRNVRYGQSRRANVPATAMTVRLVRNGRILKTLPGVHPREGRKYAAYAFGRPARNFRFMMDVTASQ